jgi:hypothetical protein
MSYRLNKVNKMINNKMVNKINKVKKNLIFNNKKMINHKKKISYLLNKNKNRKAKYNLI